MLPEDQSNNRAAIKRLMEQYGSSLFRMAAIYLKDADLAQDAVQETFLKAYQHMHTFRGDCSEKTWLTSICIHHCQNLLKTAWFRYHSRTNIDLLPETPVDFDFPDSTVLTEVMRLPAKLREVILLRYYQGLKVKEIARTLNLSDGMVKDRLKKANRGLHDRLKEWYFDEE